MRGHVACFNAYPRIGTTIFLPHLNFEIFFGFSLGGKIKKISKFNFGKKMVVLLLGYALFEVTL